VALNYTYPDDTPTGVDMALDEFSSYAEALAAWLASNRQDESQLLQGRALEEAKELVRCQSLSESDYQFLIASQELEKRELLKQLEIARQATQDVNQQIAGFLANTRTELAGPINSLIGILGLILDGAPDSREEEQEWISDARQYASSVLKRLNDLLDVAELARPEDDKFYLKQAFIKLGELLTEVENSLRAQAHEKQLNFQLIRPAAQGEIITYGDSYRLRQVLLTLVGDAITYTDEGGITIVVGVSEHKIVLQNQEHPGSVRIQIADNRNMYSKVRLLRFLRQASDSSIFQWYYTPVYGLAMSKKLIEAMSGELHLTVNREGPGATVTISLPLYQERVTKS
jgi:hypothetical protein